MSIHPDKVLLEAKTHVRCSCMNVIPLEAVHCPYCHRFNASTTAEHCPTCGISLKVQITVDALLLQIDDLNAQIEVLKKPDTP